MTCHQQVNDALQRLGPAKLPGRFTSRAARRYGVSRSLMARIFPRAIGQRFQGLFDRIRGAKAAKAQADRQQFMFSYVFADGTREAAMAPTPGDARAALKRRRGKLPTVVKKSREPFPF